MPHLIETYANNVGIKLPKIGITPVESYFPIPDKYITIHPASAQQSKVYDYFLEVVSWIKPELDKRDIKIVQVGYKGDQILSGVENYAEKCNFSQTCYVVKNALLHLGCDSVYMHTAGLYNVPVVALFGPTLPSVSGPYYKHPNSILIESHRNGLKPSLGSPEREKSINLIKPEEVINAIFKILEINPIKLETKFIGANYQNFVFESIPDKKLTLPLSEGAPLNIRMDYFNNEEVVEDLLSRYNCTLIINKPFSSRLVRKNLNSVMYEIKNADELDINFLKFLTSKSVKYQVITDQSEEVNKIKYKLLDFNPLAIKRKFEPLDFAGLDFKSSRLIISGDKMYLSYWHYLNNIPQKDIKDFAGKIPDTKSLDFWQNQDNIYVHKHETE